MLELGKQSVSVISEKYSLAEQGVCFAGDMQSRQANEFLCRLSTTDQRHRRCAIILHCTMDIKHHFHPISNQNAIKLSVKKRYQLAKISQGWQG